MTYLVCESCSGYYELKEGESIHDFESCECGGRLIHFELEEEIEAQQPVSICQNCGRENITNSAFCNGCGQLLVPIKDLMPPENQYYEVKTEKPKTPLLAGLTVIMVSIVFLSLIFAVF